MRISDMQSCLTRNSKFLLSDLKVCESNVSNDKMSNFILFSVEEDQTVNSAVQATIASLHQMTVFHFVHPTNAKHKIIKSKSKILLN